MASEAGDDFGGATDLLGGAAGSNEAGGDTGGNGGGEGGGDGGSDSGAGGDAPEWLKGLSDKPGEGETVAHRDYVASKGFRDLDSLVKSYREAEKSIRDGGRIKVPGEGAKPEELAAFRTAIGVPEKVDGYEVKAPDGVKLDDTMIGALRESALKHGAPKSAFEGLVGDFVQIQLDQAAAETKRQDTGVAEQLKEWGGKADEHIAHINTFARSVGLTKDEVAWFRTMPTGAGRALTLLSKLGAGMAEDVLQTGGSNRFGVSGAEAQVELNRLKSDPDFQAKNKPGSAERTRWDRLNRQAAEYAASKEGG